MGSRDELGQGAFRQVSMLQPILGDLGDQVGQGIVVEHHRGERSGRGHAEIISDTQPTASGILPALRWQGVLGELFGVGQERGVDGPGNDRPMT